MILLRLFRRVLRRIERIKLRNIDREGKLLHLVHSGGVELQLGLLLRGTRAAHVRGLDLGTLLLLGVCGRGGGGRRTTTWLLLLLGLGLGRRREGGGSRVKVVVVMLRLVRSLVVQVMTVDVVVVNNRVVVV